MYLGKGAVSISSTKQRIKGKSFTWDETIGVDNAMAIILWSRYFIEAQGHKIPHKKLMHDNKSAIILENIGNLFRSEQTKHMNTRH